MEDWPAHSTGPVQAGYEVICISAGRGFPLIGSTARIVTVGKALQFAGFGFRILHLGPSPVPQCTGKFGSYRGIPFEYTCDHRAGNAFIRWLIYSWALVRLTVRFCQLRSSPRRFCVYLYVMHGPFCLYVGCLCRLLGFPLVQEMCEWFPSRNAWDACSWFTRWLYRKPIFAMATGVLAISKLIEARVKQRAAAANRRLMIHRLPSIVESERFANATAEPDDVPHFLWCGVGYPQDVLFLVRVLATVHREGYHCKLRIITANYLAWGPEQILKYAADQGLPPGSVVLMGRVDDRTLEVCYKSATALLLPLSDDDQSKTRMPNKLAEYLASGRPVITCKVGELLDFLIDEGNAYLAEPDSERSFADRIIAVLHDLPKADQIGAAGQRTCLAQLDYRSHAGKLAQFFADCIESTLASKVPRRVRFQVNEAETGFGKDTREAAARSTISQLSRQALVHKE